ncbi:TPA: hypothetical protein DD455_02065 [Candidatus Shapirobacteria bacterium]|nr:hypothetical protein [Candidatus Shapirobacteria bacterium]
MNKREECPLKKCPDLVNYQDENPEITVRVGMTREGVWVCCRDCVLRKKRQIRVSGSVFDLVKKD